jgi:hypothetical protein
VAGLNGPAVPLKTTIIEETVMSELKNVRALQEIRVNGTKVAKGEVIPKSTFAAKQDWQNLLHMPKPRVEETDDKVGKPKAAAVLPGVGA